MDLKICSLRDRLTSQLDGAHVSRGDAQLGALALIDLVRQLVRLVRHAQAVLEARVRGAGVHEAASTGFGFKSVVEPHA